MKNIKIGGVIYNNVDTLKIKNADTNEYTDWKGAIPGGYTATFKVSGDDYTIISIQSGCAISKPTDPKLTDHFVAGWSLDETYASTIEFPYTLTQDTTFYAQIVQSRQIPIVKDTTKDLGVISGLNKNRIYTVGESGSSDSDLSYISWNGTKWIRENGWYNISALTEDSVGIYTGSGGCGGWNSGACVEAPSRLNAVDFKKNVKQWEQSIPWYQCLVEGTPVTLANRTTKPVEDITYDDDLLVWNFYEGKLDSAKPCWIMKPQTATKYNLCRFSNGSEVGFVGPGEDIGYHRIYNDEAKLFTHTGVPETPIGTHTFAEDGSFPELMSQEVVQKDVRFYNIGTTKHINLFANGILTSARINNKYAIQDMKYVGDRLISEEDEQKYILRVLETKC